MQLTALVIVGLFVAQDTALKSGAAQLGPTPPEMIARLLESRSGSTLAGQPISLATALAATTDRSHQIEVTHAYWRLARAVAKYHVALDSEAQLRDLKVPDGQESLAWRTAMTAARAGREDAELVALAAQHDLAAAAMLPNEGPLPLPADRPHVGPYRTHFAELFAGRMAPPRARLIDQTLPIRRRAIDLRAAAIVAAQQSQASLASDLAAGKAELEAVVAQIGELRSQREALVDLVCRYNDDIADYALAVAAPDAAAQSLVAMLITGSRDSVHPMAFQDDASSPTRNQQVAPPAATERPSTPVPLKTFGPGQPRLESPSLESLPRQGAQPTVAPPRQTSPTGDRYGAPSPTSDGVPVAAPPQKVEQPTLASPREISPLGDRYGTPDAASGGIPAAAPTRSLEQPTLAPPRDSISPIDRYADPKPAAKSGTSLPGKSKQEPSTASPIESLAPPVAPSGAFERTSANEELIDLAPMVKEPPPPMKTSPPATSSKNRSRSTAPDASNSRGPRRPAHEDPNRNADLEEAPRWVSPAAPAEPKTNELPKSPADGQSSAVATPREPALLAGEPKARTVYKPSELAPAEKAAAAAPLYAGLGDVATGKQARGLAAALHWDRSLPKDVGEPLSLEEALRDRPLEARRAIVDAYWLARQRAAECQMLSQQAELLSGLALDSGDSRGAAMLDLRKKSAEAALLESHAALIDAEYDLAVKLGRDTNGPLPLPSTAPHAASYQLKVESLPADLAQSRPVRKLSALIPRLNSSLCERAAAAVQADASRVATTGIYQGNGRSLEGVLAAIDRETDQTRAFLTSLTHYNQAIGQYALAVLPPDVSSQQLVSALVVPDERAK